jgi:hypothetical protein
MDLERRLAMLRTEPPRAVLDRLLNRLHRRAQSRRVRQRWLAPRHAYAPDDTPAGFSTGAAQQVWPGAADRTWTRDAAQRWPALHAAAERTAAQAADGVFDLLGSGETAVAHPDGRLRWHDDFKSGARFPAEVFFQEVPIYLHQDGTDIKVPWELSRFQHVFAWLWTRPDAYQAAFVRQFRDWYAANPMARGVNWACTMDVALRAVSWTAALAAWGPALDEDTRRHLWAALMNHGLFIRENLDWQFGYRTNHYFSDVVGLAVLGAVLQPHPLARAWSAFAARELRREMHRQFAPDGFNRECSTAYHRLMTELATLGWLACRAADVDLGRDFERRLGAAYQAAACVCDAAGRMPLVGDNDSGRVFPMAPRDDADLRYLLSIGSLVLGALDLPRFDAAPEAALLGGPGVIPRTPVRPDAAARPPMGLRDGGLFVLGDGSDQLTIRCGPLTYRPRGNHGHLDQLSVTVSLAGQPVLVDPGQFCYSPWPEVCRAFRHTRAHNTVVVDGEAQCRTYRVGWVGRSVVNEARPRCRQWEVDASGARFSGMHRGYRRLGGGGDHERRVEYEAAARRWRITDRLSLRGRHRVTWLFHLHPAVAVDERDGTWHLSCGGSKLTLAWLSPSFPAGRAAPGWYAPAYGRRVRTQVLTFDLQATGLVEQAFLLCAGDRA